jgi:hypothetical protein
MQEKSLSLIQNTCSGRIFLNTLGLTLDDVKDICELSHIKIFDNNKNVVGNMSYDNNKTIIVAKYDGVTLEANYKIPKMAGFVDLESDNAIYGEWSTVINFNVLKDNGTKISGEFQLNCVVDSEYGIKCRCHPLINCEVPEKGQIGVKLLRDGRLFGAEIISGDHNETIDVMPGDDMNGFIKHVITMGAYNPKKFMNEYRKYTGIFSPGVNDRDKLHVFQETTCWDKRLSFKSELIKKVGDEFSSESLIQIGMLMQELDSDMFKKIKGIRDLLIIGDISLLDNLISISCESYSDQEIEALIGLKRVKMNYQDGATSLEESYFNLPNGREFLQGNDQKRLV